VVIPVAIVRTVIAAEGAGAGEGEAAETAGDRLTAGLVVAARSGPRFVPRFLALLAGYENLTAPLFALSP
jgi:hypothetical protein